MRAVLYARVSTENQKDHNISLSEQLKSMRSFVADKHFTIIGEVQADESGYEYDRPYMNTIRDMAKKHEFDALIVFRCDRFARDEAVFMVLERFFKGCGIRLFSVQEGEFTPGTINLYLAAIQRARAQDDADSSKKRMRDARHNYSRAGIPPSPGQALYGYKKTGSRRDTKYVIHSEMAEVVRLIYSMFLDGHTIQQIVHELNDNRVPPPAIQKNMKFPIMTGKWSDLTIRNILRNPAYKGRLTVYRSETLDDGSVRFTGADEHVTIPIPAIVTEKQWSQAQYFINHNHSKWEARASHREYLLTGMVKCGCGLSMHSSTNKNAAGKPYHYYACGAYKVGNQRNRCKFDKVSRVSAEDLEYTVWDFIVRLANDPQTTMAIHQRQQEKTQTATGDITQRIAAIDELLEENKQQARRLNQMYQRNRCDQDYFDAEWSRLEEEKTALTTERTKAQAVLKKQTATQGQISDLKAVGEEIRRERQYTYAKKRKTLQNLRTVVIVERRTGEQWISVEVLGHSERVRLKNASAGRAFFVTHTESPLCFRLPLLHAP